MKGTRSMTRNQNHDDDHASSIASSSKKRFSTFDNGGVAPWSNLHHDVLYLVMMQLGVVDFLAFSGVCKSWRSLSLSNKKTFMASKPPMSVFIKAFENECCYLEDFEKRKFKTILPHSAGRIYVGVTCGYLILYGREPHDFYLVNPITRHELHFPAIHFNVRDHFVPMKGILVFSPSISKRVFVLLHKSIHSAGAYTPKISFYITGKQGWNHLSSTLPIYDLHVFKGKIYTLHNNCSLGELRLDDLKWKGKWTLLATTNFPKTNIYNLQLVSSGENLYVINRYTGPEKVLELDFGEMKWVLPEKTINEYAFFMSATSYSVIIKPDSWVGPQTRYKCYDYSLDTDQQYAFYYDWMWYFPHDCLTVNLLDER